MNKRSIWKLLFIAIGIILIPFILDNLYSTRVYDSHLTSSEWSSFNGGYIGAILGGIFTLTGIGITINFTREQAKKDREFQREQANEDRRLTIAPYLKYSMKDNTSVKIEECQIEIDYWEQNDNICMTRLMELKNIGVGALLELRVYDVTFKGIKVNCYSGVEYDTLEKESQWYILIDFRFRLDETKSKSEALVECSKRDGTLLFKIGYKDLLGNQYEQEIEMSVTIELISNYDNTRWEYSEPGLTLNKVSKCKIII
ncbi:hypothetical protein [Clostridium saccharoperbutylacetonicum]|uniref:hypothetical protein n=1 Tax=Clostridium saccharoperbutylacetonicum TaxID=36745 RepID=UPI000983F973|nr:hypothetical protein [Clostridium saccharoperbutylacetonicum]AQR98127.1 hypothetical protein CLSAP_54780 [Clostridium saccharoperbutylacetonicum]NSB34020.1 hypothetical protein [Clostridium saccharoperbutylacetonicum]